MSYNAIDYLTIAGCLAGCATFLTCCAANWDDPPEWCPNCWQPSWKKYKEKDSPKLSDTLDKNNKDLDSSTRINSKIDIVVYNGDDESNKKGKEWELV